MNGTRPHPLSLRERMRLITTGACVLMGLLGLWSLLSARPVHGALALAASLSHWVLREARKVLPQVDRVDLYETRGSGAIALLGHEGPALPI